MDTERIAKLLDRIGWPEWDGAGGVRWHLGLASHEHWYRESCDGRVYLTDYEAQAIIEKHLRERLERDYHIRILGPSAPTDEGLESGSAWDVWLYKRQGGDGLCADVWGTGPDYLTALTEACEAALKEKGDC